MISPERINFISYTIAIALTLYKVVRLEKRVNYLQKKVTQLAGYRDTDLNAIVAIEQEVNRLQSKQPPKKRDMERVR